MRRMRSKRWLSSPKGPFKGNLACSLWGNCFYRKAWNCTLNIFTEDLLCACHESQGCIVWFASKQWMSGPSCTKLCDFLNGHKLIYNTKRKIREYWKALIVPSMSMQQWPYLTSSPEHLPGVQQKASCFSFCLWPEIKILQFKLWWQFGCWPEWDNRFFPSHCSIDGRRI